MGIQEAVVQKPLDLHHFLSVDTVPVNFRVPHLHWILGGFLFPSLETEPNMATHVIRKPFNGEHFNT